MQAPTADGEDLIGAYGFTITGLPMDADRLLVPTSPDQPRLRLVIEEVRGQLPATPSARAHTQSLVGPKGPVDLVVRPSPLTATFYHDGPIPVSDIVHPLLTAAVTPAARWRGWRVFHAGGLVVDGGAWAITGTRGSGKSTLLAWLARAGLPVLTDDLLIVEDGVAHPGPRSLDLRRRTAAQLACTPLEPTRGGDRARLILRGHPPRPAHLLGWIVPVDGDNVGLERVPVAERPETLLSTAFLTRPESTELLDAAALPVLRLTRPRRFDALDRAVELLRSQLPVVHPDG